MFLSIFPIYVYVIMLPSLSICMICMCVCVAFHSLTHFLSLSLSPFNFVEIRSFPPYRVNIVLFDKAFITRTNSYLNSGLCSGVRSGILLSMYSCVFVTDCFPCFCVGTIYLYMYGSGGGYDGGLLLLLLLADATVIIVVAVVILKR